MFSLIIAVVAIALVVALVAASSYYGGSGISEAQAQAEATRLKNEEQQILAAVDMFNADKGTYPANVQELVSSGYLSAIPHGWQSAQAPGGLTLASLVIPQAYAAAADGWTTPTEGLPVFETVAGIPEAICAKYNLITRGDDGILKQAFTSLNGQCFGTGGDYKVVIYKGARSASPLVSALNAGQVLEGDLPAASGTVFWDKTPSGDVKVATDPEKTPFARLALSPSDAADLGDVDLGQSSTSSQRALVNEGNIPATGLSINAPSGFSIASNSCGSTLNAGASCAFAVKFTPASVSSYSGNVQVSSDNGGSLNFAVSGAGHQALLAVSGSANFPATQAGQFSTSGLITARNDGDRATTSLNITAPAGFSITNSNCGTSIPAASSCTFRVKFEPTDAQTYTGTIRVSSANAGNQDIAVSATAQAPAAELSIAAFGNVSIGASATQVATLTNNGVGPISVEAPSAASISGAGFSFVGTDCGLSLAAGQSCGVTTRFTPTIHGAQAGTLTLDTGAGVKTANLSGQGQGSVAVMTSASPVALADWYQAGTKTASVSYRNDGNSPMTLNSPALSSPLSVPGNTCTNVAPTASCSITVALTRDANTGGSGSQSFVPSGAHVAPAGAKIDWSIWSVFSRWSTTSLDFGSVQMGKTAIRSITLYNDGASYTNWATNNTIYRQPAGFTFDLSACSNVASNGGSCPVTVTFSPSAAGSYGGNGVIPVSISGYSNSLTLSGTGLSDPAIVASTSNVSQSTTSGSAGSQAVTFTNNGDTPTTLNLAWVSGGSGISFSPATLTCPAKGSCGSTTLTGSSSAGTYTGTLRATPAAGGTAATVNATFTVTAPVTNPLALAVNTNATGQATAPGTASRTLYFRNTTGQDVEVYFWLSSWQGDMRQTTPVVVMCRANSNCDNGIGVEATWPAATTQTLQYAITYDASNGYSSGYMWYAFTFRP